MEPTPADTLFLDGGDDDELGGGARPNGTGGWVYLAVLAVVFLVLAVVAYGCEDEDLHGVDTVAAAVEPAELTLRIAGTMVTLEGRVPDQAGREQLVELARARYGATNVVDTLVIDEGTTMEDGAVAVAGTTVEGDTDPTALQADIAGALMLRVGPVSLTFTQPPEQPAEEVPPAEEVAATPPAELVASVTPELVVLTGQVPDADAATAATAAAEAAWGAGTVDASALTVADSTWEGGRIVLVGTVDVGDTRAATLAESLAAAAAGAVSVDSAGVVVDTSGEAVARLQARVAERLAAEPIVFTSASSTIDPSSEAVLQALARTLGAAPGLAVEVVGHTDDVGSATVNQRISQERAQAVVDRLVELGVDPARLTARGAGLEEPIADNTTEEGRAQNRRIELRFEGAAQG